MVEKIFIISGPSGSGKTALLKRLFKSVSLRKKFIRVPTVTTRSPRRGERNGKDYHFLTREEFLKLKKKGFFLETKKYLEDFYGTPKNFLKEVKGKFPILCIDVEGALKIKRKFKERVVLIFLHPPSWEDLRIRLEKRRTEALESLKKRLRIAEKEVKYAKKYKYHLVNRDLEETTQELKKLLLKETGL